MNELNIDALRKKVAELSASFKIVRRGAVEYVGRLDDGSDIAAPYEGYGKNVYRIDGTELLVNDWVSDQLDNMVGVTPRHKKAVKAASGETGIRDFRNYLASANSMVRPQQVALIANTHSKTVSGLVPIKKDPITSDSFFDFVELFTDKNGLYPVKYETNHDTCSGITIYFDSYKPEVQAVVPGDDFLINSYYLRWNLGQIELGRYYERLVCSNGQIRVIKHKDSRIYSVQEEDISRIIAIPGNTALADSDFDMFSNKAREAMQVRASLAELKYVAKHLENYMVDNESAMAIAPYSKESEMYLHAGYGCSAEEEHKMLASMSVWDLYNRVTDYASNNEFWSETDNRRGALQSEALNFLMKKRDIQSYTDIFG